MNCSFLVSLSPSKIMFLQPGRPALVPAARISLSSADPAALYLSMALIAGALLLGLVWVVLSLATRPRRSAGAQTPLSRARTPRGWRHPVWALVFLALAALGAYLGWRYVEDRRAAWADYRAYIRPGVYVSGVDAGGMTADQIRRQIEDRDIAPLRRQIAVRYGEHTTTLDTTTLGLQTNLEEIVGQAVAVQETDPELEFRAFLWRDPPPYDVHLSLTYTFDYARLEPWVEALAAEVEQPPLEPAWDVKTLTWTAGQPGQTMDVQEAVRRLSAAVPDLSITEVELPLAGVPAGAWTDEQIGALAAQAAFQWRQPPVPAETKLITIPFDYERWIGPGTPARDWQPTRPMTGYTFLPGQMGWALDADAAADALRAARDTGATMVTPRIFTDVAPLPLTLADIKPALLDIARHFDGLTGFYVQDLTTGAEIRHNTHITTSGMSMIKVAIMVTAYRTLPRPFDTDLEAAMFEMVAHSINEKSNYVIDRIGEGDFELGLMRVNETLQALGMYQTYIAAGYAVPTGPYGRIAVPERPAVDVPVEERLDLWPDTSMQTSLSDQALIFQALYYGAQGTGPLQQAYPELTAADYEEMLDLLKANPTRTLLGPGFADEVPMAHKNGFGGGGSTDERMDVGIVWPPGGRPYIVGLYQWDKQDWIHWLRVWPQQIEFSTTLYNYFTMPETLPAPAKPTFR